MKTQTKRKYNRKKKSPIDVGTKLHKQAAAYGHDFETPMFKDEEVADALRAHGERRDFGDQRFKEGYEKAKHDINTARSEAAIKLMSAVGQTIQAMASAFGEMPRN